MDKAIEAIARAMAARCYPADEVGFESFYHQTRDRWRADARAAYLETLRQIREPHGSSVMGRAICENIRRQEEVQGIEDIRDKWPDDAELHCDEMAMAAVEALIAEAESEAQS